MGFSFGSVLLALLLVASGLRLSKCTKFTITNNKRKETIYPGITPNNFSGGDLDYYDVSLVERFQFADCRYTAAAKAIVAPPAATPICAQLPTELTLKSDGKIIACQSACNVFDTDEYCCRGAFSTPMACLPTNYSRIFKTACPAAYSFAYDDPTSILTCSAADYIVSFCSSRNQTQCTYHDNKVICNGGASGILEGLSQAWRIMLMVFGIAISIPVML
ncbi:hypothetical protein DH2020_011167 [Rehmannia glutinosa]|uniref:Thaumatin-like protein n=1 Tax=Rehmannia glutinosa TaxID=99300 RepID=A0ABR0XCM0_REHGL